jgi:hypothetical protein
MPRKLFDHATTPREVCEAAGITPGALETVSLDCLPGRVVRVRSAVKYYVARIGVDKGRRENASLAELKAWFNGPRAVAVFEANTWDGHHDKPLMLGETGTGETGTGEDDVSETGEEKPRKRRVSGGGFDALMVGLLTQIAEDVVEEALERRPAFDKAEIERIAQEAAKMTRVEVKLGEGLNWEQVPGEQHESFPDLLRHLSLRDNVYLYGPAGSGKSTAAKQAAQALKLNLGTTGKVDSKYDLLGFRDAHGRVVRTPFREIWESGGLFLFDELDRSDPSAVVALNNGLATGSLDFPDGTVAKHETTLILGGGNTSLGGGDRTYTAGVAQDGSVRDRFVFLPWGYDEGLELRLVGTDAKAIRWAHFVQAVRRAAGKLKIDVLATPRASIQGARALLSGMALAKVEERYLWKGLDSAAIAKIKAEASVSP